MNHLTPESEQREYVEKCRAATRELTRDAPRTAKELLRLHDEKLRQKAAQIPQYERD